jgi:phage gpG-like protein
MNISNELNKILKEQELELANLMYQYLSFQFGENVAVTNAWVQGDKGAKALPETSQNKTKELRYRTGALLNSFFTNDFLTYSNGVFSGEIKSELDYARIHEYGGFIKSKMAGGKFIMAKGLFKKFFETGDEAYKYMAFAVMKNGGINMPARPYFNPFINEMNKDGLPKWWSEVEKRLNIFINEVTINV